MSEPSLELPELTESVLGAEEVGALFRDLVALTKIVEIIPKRQARGYVDDSTKLSLDDAREGILSGEFRGLQIRYLYDGGLWWDTLICSPKGINIVRIRHDIDADVGTPR